MWSIKYIYFQSSTRRNFRDYVKFIILLHCVADTEDCCTREFAEHNWDMNSYQSSSFKPHAGYVI